MKSKKERQIDGRGNEEIFTKLQLTIKWWVNAFTSNVQEEKRFSLPFLDYNTA
jgi:hypothetical protein